MRWLGVLTGVCIYLKLTTGQLSSSIANSSLDLDFPLNIYELNLKQLLQRILWAANVKRCFAVITDDLHSSIYDRRFFESAGRQVVPFFVLRINASEDLRRPTKRVELILEAIRASDCELHVMTILNGWQVQRFLRYIYDSRSLDAQSKFILLHDSRLFERDMLHLWSGFLGAVFLKWQLDERFIISTIAFPGILSGVLVMKNIANWEMGKSVNGRVLFVDKTSNLYGASMPVAISEHVPMVMWLNTTNSYQGVEVEIMNALGQALNFKPIYYKPNQSENAEWELGVDGYGNGNSEGYVENETRIDSLLIEEVASHNARFAIGDLHQFQIYLQSVELSLPHNFDCLTFLTPESSTDNSWQTFILPFSGGMWAGVLLSLFIVGTVFYGISFLNAILTRGGSSGFFRCLRQSHRVPLDPKIYRRVSFRIAIARYRPSKGSRSARDLFDDYTNCILLTYSMLLYVALPRMPRNWPLRVLTGWYWIYCILLVATYRASFTAILANPAASLAIIPLFSLLIFKFSFENCITARIAKGQCAYYDNEFYLRYLRVADDSGSGIGSTLHIMKDCVVIMPVVLAMEKNSPLRKHVDKSIQHLAEGGRYYSSDRYFFTKIYICFSGLITKWLKDAIQRLPAEAPAQQEALMNLQKFWSSFVALGIGYVISLVILMAERWHYRHIVMKHPMFDIHNRSLYYNFKRIYPEQ
ncbi:hypothetical protein KR032_010800 [Drosophila birchii]|nr:hypothetical protein KR032_010800 [Drosophila birchii]